MSLRWHRYSIHLALPLKGEKVILVQWLLTLGTRLTLENQLPQTTHSPWHLGSHLSILEYKEPHIPAMMNVVLPEQRRGVVLDPHSSKLVVVNVI